MKRSEILQIITNELCVHEDAVMTYSGCKKLAELLLKKIEDAGMKPPFNREQGHEWEPETQETK